MTVRVDKRDAARIALALLGAALVIWWLAERSIIPMWALPCVSIATLGWIVAVASRRMRTVMIASSGVAIVAGSIAAAATGGIALIPAGVAVLLVWADDRYPRWAGGCATGTSLVLVAVGAILAPFNVEQLVLWLSLIVIVALVGYSRRQVRDASAQANALRDRQRAQREDAARVALARDLHDVLAHTLGGLVVQLDATEAVLEHGDTLAALHRVHAAAELARSGLTEARHAIAALREPPAPSSATRPEELDAAVQELTETHRALGGSVDVVVNGSPRDLTAGQATTLRRALQEQLSNARRHAPGATVTVTLSWLPHTVVLEVGNPVAAERTPSPGGGYGIEGMRERVRELPAGGSVHARDEHGMFRLTVQVST